MRYHQTIQRRMVRELCRIPPRAFLPVVLLQTLGILLPYAACAATGARGERPSAAPIAETKRVGWSHGPYEVGDCGVCHETKSKTAQDPGPVRQSQPALCADCHDEFMERLAKQRSRHAATDRCTDCHNPHNAADSALLLKSEQAVCRRCHARISSGAHAPKSISSPTKPCTRCHEPHASDRKALLKKDRAAASKEE